MWNNSDAEGAIQIVGAEDFVCGYHGDEKVDAINIIIDGKPIDMANDYDIEFDVMTILSTSRVYHCNTSASAGTQAFTRNTTIKIEKDKVTISNRFECLEDLVINRAAIALFQCYKSSNGKTLINKFSNNNDLVLYDVPTTATGAMPSDSKDMTEVTFYSDFGEITVKLNKGNEHEKYMGYMQNFDSQKRLKVYFDYIKGATNVKTGDILQSEFEINFK